MKPSASSSYFISNNSAYSINTRLKHDLILSWREWAKKVPAGNGELRDSAVIKLMHCLDYGDDKLDLSGLNLTALPEIFPEKIKELDLSVNQLTTLSQALPPEIKKLDVSFNQLTHIDLPSTLETVNVSHNQLTTLHLPLTLKIVNASHNQITHLQEDLPNLNELDISHNHLTSLPDALLTVNYTNRNLVLNVDHNRFRSTWKFKD